MRRSLSRLATDRLAPTDDDVRTGTLDRSKARCREAGRQDFAASALQPAAMLTSPQVPAGTLAGGSGASGRERARKRIEAWLRRRSALGARRLPHGCEQPLGDPRSVQDVASGTSSDATCDDVLSNTPWGRCET